MVLLEAALVIGMVWLIVYGSIRLLSRPPELTEPSGRQRTVSRPGQWRTAHYDVDGQTRVVVQKVGEGSDRLLDEHVIATVRIDDPEYDDKFLSAMNTARQRRSLFEAEEES